MIFNHLHPKRPIVLAMTGAGSTGFTRQLVGDILSVPELKDTEFRFHDINPQNLEMVEQLIRRDASANGIPEQQMLFSQDRATCFQDADVVICMIRQGGLEAFRTDIEIPLKYGVDQCVGDTLCAGGLMYAQRTIAELLEICNDIRRQAKPGALFLNYSNPMAMNTRACNQYGGVTTVGLCHGVHGTTQAIADCLTIWAKAKGLIGDEEKLLAKDLDVVGAGINHQTWFFKVQWQGMDLVPLMEELMNSHPTFPQSQKVRIDVLKRFGFFSTESNGHLSEYLPWYRKRPEELDRWIDMRWWNCGRTGGYLDHCVAKRDWFNTDFPKWMEEDPASFLPENRSHEHASYLLEALKTGRIYRGHLNIINRGHISNLPDGCVVEVPCYTDRNGIAGTHYGDLPLACAATCSASVRVQEMGVEAAVHGDVTLLKQAMLHDPLVAAACDPEEIWQMTDELLLAQEKWLPQYAPEAFAAARERLQRHEQEGTRVAPRPVKDFFISAKELQEGVTSNLRLDDH